MNEAVPVATDGQLTTAELAALPDFTLGGTTVSPSNRTIAGPGGTADVEPRIMQVLVVLAGAEGRVVSRERLFERCWGGVYVGDDSLNRVIAAIRKLAAEIAGGSFAVETVRQAGYRLNGSEDAPAPVAAGSPDIGQGSSRRRVLVVGGAAVAVAAAGGAAWWSIGRRGDPRSDGLIDRGLAAMRYGDRRADSEAVRDFSRAAELQPASARARGLLAYALAATAQSGPAVQAGAAVEDAQRAAHAALRLDPKDPDALTALVLIEQSPRGRAAVEDGLRRILAQTPDHPRAMILLERLLQGAGRAHESWELNERLIAIEPISPTYQLRRALKLWVFGRSEEAQRASQYAMDLWPAHPLVRMARLLICAFTDRTGEARALVEEEAGKSILLSPEGRSVWRASLQALATPSPPFVAAARKANVEGARSSPPLAAYGLVVMSALGELDAAFEIANGFLLAKGPVVLERTSASRNLWSEPLWRNTLGLFTPPTRAMRLDPRFGPLCDGLGLTEYWRQHRRPDAFLFR